MLKNTNKSYGVVAKSFHWLLFMLLSFSVVAGNIMTSMPKGSEKYQAIGLHKSFGLIILLLVLLRLIWKIMNPTPDDSKDATTIQNMLARVMHWLL